MFGLGKNDTLRSTGAILPLILAVSLFAAIGIYRKSIDLSFLKKDPISNVYEEHQQTFYCGCRFDMNRGGENEVDRRTCPFSANKDYAAGKKIRYGNIMPISFIGKHYPCWADGGLEACLRDNQKFDLIVEDLHNKAPIMLEIANDTEEYPANNISGHTYTYGACPIEVDESKGIIEPGDVIKGNVARTYLYMIDQYKIPVKAEYKKMLEAWSKKDPVDEWEILKNRLVYKEQGTWNYHIESWHKN